MIIRVGIEGNRRAVLDRARAMGAPILVSANSLWDNKRKRFRDTWRAYDGFNVALDSGGFVAMKLFGGYRFTVEQYVALAKQMAPEWWAQMDLCCEPEIASNAAEVARRIDGTARNLQACQSAAARIGAARPMPVLQGWKPDDYTRGPAYDDRDFIWPDLVGVGSVCRRKLHGSDGLLAVMTALDRALPPHVRLHFFGVKGAAISHLKDHPRFASMDSMAWNRAASWDAHKRGVTRDNALRADHMEQWTEQQRERAKQTQQILI